MAAGRIGWHSWCSSRAQTSTSQRQQQRTLSRKVRSSEAVMAASTGLPRSCGGRRACAVTAAAAAGGGGGRRAWRRHA